MNTAIVVPGDQRTKDWYKNRLGVITASSCETIMSKYQRAGYINKLIAEKLTGVQESLEFNANVKWGNEQEEFARLYYEKQTGNSVEEVSFVFADDKKRVGCSPDGFVGEDGLIEIKCPMSKTHIGYITEQSEPKKYFLQMQFQMYVTGRKWCDFVSFDPRLPKEIKMFIKRIDIDLASQIMIDKSVKETILAIDKFLTKNKLEWK